MTADPCVLVPNPCLQFSLETGFTHWLAAQRAVSDAPTIAQPLLETLEGLTCNWMTLALAGTCATGAIATTAFLHLVSLPPVPDCTALPIHASVRDQLTCVQEAIARQPTESLPWAMNWVQQWQPNHPLYGEGQQLLALWEHSRSHSAPQAISLPAPVSGGEAHRDRPALSPALPLDAPPQAAEKNRSPSPRATPESNPVALYATAQTALQGQDWAGAFQALWQLQAWEQATGQAGLAATLVQQIEAERQAQNHLNQALQAYLRNAAGDRADAIQRLQAIDPTTYVGRSVPPLLVLWQTAHAPHAPTSGAAPVSNPRLRSANPLGILTPEGSHHPAFATPFQE